MRPTRIRVLQNLDLEASPEDLAAASARYAALWQATGARNLARSRSGLVDDGPNNAYVDMHAEGDERAVLAMLRELARSGFLYDLDVNDEAALTRLSQDIAVPRTALEFQEF